MNDLWKKEYLHQVLGLQREVLKSLPNPLKEGEVVLVPDDREKTSKFEDGGCPAAHYQWRWKMPCCYCADEGESADATILQTVQIGALC